MLVVVSTQIWTQIVDGNEEDIWFLLLLTKGRKEAYEKDRYYNS